MTGTEDLNYVGFSRTPSKISVEKNSSTSMDIYISTTKTTNSDRTFNVLVGSGTTLDPANYTVPTSITVPANSNVGVITAVFSDVTLGEDAKSFVLELENRSDMFVGTKLTTTIEKKCSLSGVSALVGSFSVTTNTSGLENSIVTELDGQNIKILNLGESIMTGWWGEEITKGGSCIMTVDLTTGALTIPKQYFMDTLYDGAPSTYQIAGSGTWNNCGATTTLQLTYDIYYTGDTNGIGKDYRGKAFGGTFSKN